MVAICWPAFTLWPLFTISLSLVGIGGDVILAVLNHDQIAIAAQLIADVDHLARPGGIHRLAAGSGDINTFIAAIGGGIRQDHFGRWSASASSAVPPAARRTEVPRTKA